MKRLTFNPNSVTQLAGIFFGATVFMSAYEFTKQLLFSKTLTLWQSHVMTIIMTSLLATMAASYMRKWAAGEIDVRIAATAFETQDGMMVIDAHEKILRVNHAFTGITGYTEEEAVGLTFRQFISGRHDDAFYAAIRHSLLNNGTWQGEIWNRNKNGEEFPSRLLITAVTDKKGKITHYVSSMHDITNRKQNEEKIRTLAFYDTLTQLPNRRLLDDRLAQAMAASKRSGLYCALMFLDLDNFKSLNDTHGHGAGDFLLIEAAHRLTSCVREVDTVARFGGDEFVVLLSQLDEDKVESTTQAGIVAEKIRTDLFEPYFLTIQHEGKAETIAKHRSAASIGLVLFVNHEARGEDIIKWADTAMYQAKKAGRNQIRIYEPIS